MSDDSHPPRRQLTIMLVPDGGQKGRTFTISYPMLRVLGGVAVVVALLVAGSSWYVAARASHVSELEDKVATLEGERVQVQSLARQLEGIERQYTRIQDMFGARTAATPSDAWLAPIVAGRRSSMPRTTARASTPSSWPLSERGFVTQGLLDGAVGQEEHPGLDIAVATDSYIRASGAGTVVDVGVDSIYGNFVVLDHGDGYTTLYGHASLSLVTRGERVRQDEVIALSGSTGRSTAPHLHFEVLLNGDAVDPLTLVHQP